MTLTSFLFSPFTAAHGGSGEDEDCDGVDCGGAHATRLVYTITHRVTMMKMAQWDPSKQSLAI